MLKQWIVDPAEVPWRDGLTEGISFRGQVLFDGNDGGPEAFRFKFDPTPSVYAHMHLTPQFQVLLGGQMDLPRASMKLRPPAVHYTDHNRPYGPFAVSGEHEVLVLHPKKAGLISMGDRDARRQINLKARELSGMFKDIEWTRGPGNAGGRWKVLIRQREGPEALLLECPPSTLLAAGVPTHGRYEVVVEGSVLVDGRLLKRPSLRYVVGDEQAEPLTIGEDGATIMYFSFDKDALEGGLTGQGIAVAAAEGMARAI